MEQYTAGVNLSQVPGVPSNAGSTDQSQSPLHHANMAAATGQPGIYPNMGAQQPLSGYGEQPHMNAYQQPQGSQYPASAAATGQQPTQYQAGQQPTQYPTGQQPSQYPTAPGAASSQYPAAYPHTAAQTQYPQPDQQQPIVPQVRELLS